MYYYDNDDNDLYFDLDKMFNDDLDLKDESEEFSKFFSDYDDCESDLLDGICKISLPENIDDFHNQSIQEFYKNYF
jgi:hypothetical protein